jgi:hypothetical protein
VADPFEPPKQETFTVAVMVAVGEPALVTETVLVMTHPFASVMVQV